MRVFLLSTLLLLGACASAPQHHLSSDFLSAEELRRLASGNADQLEGVSHTVSTVQLEPSILVGDHVSLPTLDHDHHYDALISEAPLAVRVQSNQAHGFVETESGVVHGPSGISCSATYSVPNGDDPAINMALQRVNVYQEDGTDVGCHYASSAGDVIFTLYASQWPDVTVQQHAAAAVNDIARSFPNLSTADTPVVVMTPEGETLIEETVGGGFDFALPDGRTGQTALYISKVGGWHIKARVTTLPKQPSVMVWSTILQQLQVLLVNERQMELRQLGSA